MQEPLDCPKGGGFPSLQVWFHFQSGLNMMRDWEGYLTLFNEIHSCLLFFSPFLLHALSPGGCTRSLLKVQQRGFGKLCFEDAGPKEGRSSWCSRVVGTRLGAHTVLVNVHYPVPSQSPGFPLRQGEGSISPSTGGCFQPSRAVPHFWGVWWF